MGSFGRAFVKVLCLLVVSHKGLRCWELDFVGLRERGNDTSRSTGHSGRQKAATRRNMRREERVTVQGPVTKQQPDGMSHRGLGKAPPPPGTFIVFPTPMC